MSSITLKQPLRIIRFLLGAALSFASLLSAAEHHGVVSYGDLPLPGATVIATQGDKKLSAISGEDGAYSFPDLADGMWSLQAEMLCFAPAKQDVLIGPGAPPVKWEMKLLPIAEIKAAAVAAPAPSLPPVSTTSVAAPASAPKPTIRGKKGAAPPPQVNTPGGFQRAGVNASANAAPGTPASEAPATPIPGDLNQTASDSLAINGSQNNGAASAFSQSQAFGNSRRGPGSLFNGNIVLNMDNSFLDARPFSLTGQNTPRPGFNLITAAGNFGGPLLIPHLLNARNAPTFFVGYQLIRNKNASTLSALVPTEAQREGNIGQTVIDPMTGSPFPGNVIPTSRISPQAAALLKYYPLPNFDAAARYNYQAPSDSQFDQDGLTSRVSKNIGRYNQVFGTFNYQNTRNSNSNANIFAFDDRSNSQAFDAAANWMHRFSQRTFTTFRYNFTRFSSRSTPYFANRVNVSGDAGITGNDQTANNWGPPSLSFSSGIQGLSDAQQSFNRNETNALSVNTFWSHSPHNVTYGADFRRQQFNALSQQNARGSFSFNGQSAGSDFGGFLLGIPDTSNIAFGNADKYFRASNYDAFVNDDWRVSPSVTLNGGLRWNYGAPITELYGRLVNLDITPGFTAEVPVIGNNPKGALTGRNYPTSLLNPDKHAIEPRIGLAWRPISGSSLVVRAGYAIGYNTSVYQSIATQMAQQSPLSKSLSVQNSAANPLTLANGFNATPGVTPNTFAVDPDYRIGYAHNWQASVQRDLPGSLVMTATYLGIKGTRAGQAFLPNTYPVGAVNPCPSCPAGYTYLTSNGNSTREAGQFQLRRRLHNGITATAQYVYSKSLDDAALGGRGQGSSVIAQNWLNLSGERGRSNFDQRHLLSLQAQYSTGVGIGGGTLLNGWRGAIFKDWTIAMTSTVGSGFPLTPTYLNAVAGTGVTGPLRPDYTGASLYDAPPGLFLNPAAVRLPGLGLWGNAGRNSIEGPNQFTLNGSLARTFRLRDRMSMDLTINSTNVLNHVTFPNWNTVVTSAQFGLPTSANAMRDVQANVRVRF